jgi:hypothetical protein
MNLRKLTRIAADLLRTNIAFVRSGSARARIREGLKIDSFAPHLNAIVLAETKAAPPAAQPYARLAENSLALTAITVDGSRRPALNLLVGEVRVGGVFAGIHTALTTAIQLAGMLGVGIRIVMLDPTSTDNSRDKVERFVRAEFGLGDVQVVTRDRINRTVFGEGDYWLATHSKTAHALQVACRTGLVNASRAAYLIQDYEPGFSPWSTESILAESTYRAGFVPIVNSVPLWEYLTATVGLDIPRELVFSPAFELDRLRAAAEARIPHPTVRVLYYGRRSKHRNLFALGISGLKAAALALGDDVGRVEFISAGETHDDIELGNGATLTSRGRLPWGEYFEFLSTTDVVLSLQQSPHPSHPPFDAAISGALAVTNDFGGGRSGLHPRITAVPADTESLRDALVIAIRESLGSQPAGYLPVGDGVLGLPLDHVLESVAARLSA